MLPDLFQLTDRTALVTGASRGLGQAMAYGLAQAGTDVACVSRGGEAKETRELVESTGRRFLDLKADLANAGDRKGLIDRAVAEFGRLDILVNNAGGGGRYAPEDYPDDEWRELLEVHLFAAFDLCKQAEVHFFRQGRGKIVNIGSLMSFEAGWQISAYAAAKHGIAGLTKSLATAWASRGINVNCIAPGYFDTDLTEPLRNDPVRGPQLLDRIPAGRWGQPDEIAGLCVFLASDASNYMHGSVVPIDGGWLAR